MKARDISEITYTIIGAGMSVHGALGNGFQEVVYQRAMGVELRMRGLSYEREKSMQIYYRGEAVGERRVDFYVEDAVMVELKAVAELDAVHMAQAKNYLEAYGVRDGLLLNFGSKSLGYKHIYLSEKTRSPEALSQESQKSSCILVQDKKGT